ncbi:MAG: hypothetical protein RLY86_4073, partial [Pseudomonadota bacterium]
EGGRVVWTREVLIRPPELRFTPFTIAVHGIRPEHVAHAPEFPEVWAALEPDLRGAVLLAHNASFDMGVLHAMLGTYGLPVPGHDFLCTLLTARRLWPTLERHKLNSLAYHFGIELNHHKAGSDARACAEIALRAMDHTGTTDAAALAQAAGLGLGRLGSGPGGDMVAACRVLPGRPEPRRPPTPDLPSIVAKPELFGAGIAFTGALATLSRGEAEALAHAAGLVPQGSVTRATDFLVVGRTTDSTKLRNARRRAAIDGRPRLLDEREYRDLLGLDAMAAPAA